MCQKQGQAQLIPSFARENPQPQGRSVDYVPWAAGGTAAWHGEAPSAASGRGFSGSVDQTTEVRAFDSELRKGLPHPGFWH